MQMYPVSRPHLFPSPFLSHPRSYHHNLSNTIDLGNRNVESLRAAADISGTSGGEAGFVRAVPRVGNGNLELIRAGERGLDIRRITSNGGSLVHGRVAVGGERRGVLEVALSTADGELGMALGLDIC